MKSLHRLKGVYVALAILLVCIPIALVFALLTASLWLWWEQTFAIEAYGHSGPADWCYLFSYGLIVAVSTLIWALVKKEK